MTPKNDVSKVRKEGKRASKKDAGKPKVKRALTPYFMFAQENREKVKVEFGFESKQLGEIAKKLGEKWKNIGRGLVLLVGIKETDTMEELDYCVRKCMKVRLWDDDKGTAWRASVLDKDYQLLVISQFTLFGLLRKGNKPDYRLAMGPGDAEPMYDEFVRRCRAEYGNAKGDTAVQTGIFGAHMDVSLNNDGPVTLVVDTDEYMPKDPKKQK
ncbi:D-tyrosyl-tRNA(Tyr) deacylase [Perkinsus olseni]|uniref:D-aminoacyl-tRNA deacylase n=1 Tax=Perkinsus olseni TaxID=32597 RepID=A0A7J6MBE4_PEROL|nr:D-tyrosyl-tRNA(Tyr) deacylase [Perkinsus olseni]